MTLASLATRSYMIQVFHTSEHLIHHMFCPPPSPPLQQISLFSLWQSYGVFERDSPLDLGNPCSTLDSFPVPGWPGAVYSRPNALKPEGEELNLLLAVGWDSMLHRDLFRVG